MSIETKTIATLIDELMTTSQKCWHAQEKILDKTLSERERLDAAEMAQNANRKRCELMTAIDHRFGEGKGSLKKTY